MKTEAKTEATTQANAQAETAANTQADASADAATTPPPDARVTALERELSTLRKELSSATRSHDIDTALNDAGVIRLVPARALVQKTLDAAKPGADAPSIENAVTQVKRRAPALFRDATPPSAALAPTQRPGEPPLHTAHRDALAGDRRALLRYLRLRRQGG